MQHTVHITYTVKVDFQVACNNSNILTIGTWLGSVTKLLPGKQ